MPGAMNSTPATTPPRTPRTRHPMRIAICEASGPGSTCTKFSARTNSASSQPAAPLDALVVHQSELRDRPAEGQPADPEEDPGELGET